MNKIKYAKKLLELSNEQLAIARIKTLKNKFLYAEAHIAQSERLTKEAEPILEELGIYRKEAQCK